MSKRNSLAAHLPSLEDMADDMQVDARHSYGNARVSPYGPMPHPPTPFAIPASSSPPSVAASSSENPIPDHNLSNNVLDQPIVRPWGTRAQWENLGFHEGDSTDAPTPPSNSPFQENIAILISLQ